MPLSEGGKDRGGCIPPQKSWYTVIVTDNLPAWIEIITCTLLFEFQAKIESPLVKARGLLLYARLPPRLPPRLLLRLRRLLLRLLLMAYTSLPQS